MLGYEGMNSPSIVGRIPYTTKLVLLKLFAMPQSRKNRKNGTKTKKKMEKKLTPKRRSKLKRPQGSSEPIIGAAVAYNRTNAFSTYRSNLPSPVCASEFIGPVMATTDFSVTKYVIQPGISDTFPYLAQEAKRWQQYRFRKLRFRFETQTMTGNSGVIILSPEYNPAEAAPTTERDACNTKDAIEGVVWKELVCEIDVAAMFPMGGRKQVRTAGISGDQNIYDCGNLNVCSKGTPIPGEVGKLWVDYECDFWVPQTRSLTVASAPSSLYQISWPDRTMALPTGNPPVALPFCLTGSGAVVDYNTYSIPPADVKTFSIIPPAGTYFVYMSCVLVSSVESTFLATLNLFYGGAPATLFVVAAGGSTDAALADQVPGLCIGCGYTTFNGTDMLQIYAVAGSNLLLPPPITLNKFRFILTLA